MSVLAPFSFGAYKPRARGEASDATPWTESSNPPDSVCAVCQEEITSGEAANVQWAPCGHFGHIKCPDYGGYGFGALGRCPNCKKLKPLIETDLPDFAAETRAMQDEEEERRLNRIRADVNRARTDPEFWNTITRAERMTLFGYVDENHLPPLPYDLNDAHFDYGTDDEDEDDDEEYHAIIRTEEDCYRFIMESYPNLRSITETEVFRAEDPWCTLYSADMLFFRYYYPDVRPVANTIFEFSVRIDDEYEEPQNWYVELAVYEDEGDMDDDMLDRGSLEYCRAKASFPEGFKFFERVRGSIGTPDEANVYDLFCRVVREAVHKAYLDVAGEQRGALLDHPFGIVDA
jgi:hypothetical protein